MLEPLLAEIEKFTADHGVSERRLGELALNDTKFVPAIRSGARSPSLKTVAKLRNFMFAYAAQRDEAA